MDNYAGIIKDLEEEIRKFNSTSETIVTLAKKLDHYTLTKLCYRYFSETYDRHMEETGHFTALRRALEASKEYILGTSLLDVSCGTGEALHYLTDNLNKNNIAVTANDFSAEMIALAKEKLVRIEQLLFSDIDLNQKPCVFRDLNYDTVLCSYSIHSFPEPKPIIPLIRAVKNCGHLIFIEEWPCLVTSSTSMPASVAEFLALSEKPLETVLGTAQLENLIIQDGSFVKMAVGDRISLGTLMAQWPFMCQVASGCFKIDGKHQLYVHVYEKLQNPGIL